MTLHVWTVPARALPRVLVRMARDRGAVRRLPGVQFAKLLGTGSGFSPRDADVRRWALLTCWASPGDAAAFETSATLRRWQRLATGTWRAELAPLHSRGRWAGVVPFGAPASSSPGPVLALTRARLRPSTMLGFWRAVPPVAADAHAADGLLSAFGVGEAPLGVQGTVSVWRDAAALRAFAQSPEHAAVVAATTPERWYSEELFARFSVLAESGARPGTGSGARPDNRSGARG